MQGLKEKFCFVLKNNPNSAKKLLHSYAYLYILNL